MLFILDNAVWTLWLFGTFIAYCCVFFNVGVGAVYVLTLVYCAGPPATSELVSGFSASSLDFIFISLPELLGGRVEYCIQFFELVNSTFVHICL